MTGHEDASQNSTQDTPYADRPSEEEARGEEQAWTDSAESAESADSAAVSPDTERADPGEALPEGTPPSPITVNNPEDAETPDDPDAPRPAGHADEDRS